MDPFTLALATFGIQKLRGKSTRQALESAAIIGGGAYGLGKFGGVEALQGSPFQSLGFGKATTPVPKGNIGPSFLNKANMPKGTPIGTDKFVDTGRYSGIVKSRGGELSGLNVVEPAKKGIASNLLEKAKENPLQSAFIASTVAPLLVEEEEPKPAFTEEDYKKAYEEQRDNIRGSFVLPTDVRPSRDEVTGEDMFYANEGGLATAISKYNKGGVNYLPSKIDHDENDVNNYVRATGYVEDGAGAGDKDEDTMLAQLADGEFVSRADAVLGAGILSGADPKNFKGMRKAGADFFYNQQKQLKRI
jgi:hypothetical protein